MSEHDLQARPIYHHLRESIEAHLSIVVAVMAVSHHIESKPVGASRNSCAPHAATAPSRSKQGDNCSLPPTHCPRISAKRSLKSASTLNTKLSQLGTTPTQISTGSWMPAKQSFVPAIQTLEVT